MFIFEIIGDPVPQKQTRFTRNGHTYNPSSKDIERLQWQIRPNAPVNWLVGPVEMHLTFYMPIPKSASSRMKLQMRNEIILPDKKPDFDNLAYLVTNALKGIVYKDDAQVTDCVIRKRYSDKPRTVIKVIPIDDLQQVGGSPCG
jgi:Holliday junction resolvase RusA-like endonuclease